MSQIREESDEVELFLTLEEAILVRRAVRFWKEHMTTGEEGEKRLEPDDLERRMRLAYHVAGMIDIKVGEATGSGNDR